MTACGWKWRDRVSRTRGGILHAAPLSRDAGSMPSSPGPRLCSAPLREELRAALRPGHEVPSCRYRLRRFDLIAQHEFLDLAGRCLRDRPEHHRLRRLEPGHVSTAEC